ncbi:aquaporin family protein [Bdellovibrio sp. qaytius]|nr:aquaporin family protein [Bdellovibrio sp. qaytius]
MTSPKYLVEFAGSLFLAMIVIGSGIMGEQLSNGNVAVALLANSLATGFGLIVIILAFGPISGAHFNPAVTLVSYFDKSLIAKEALNYIIFQILGMLIGVWITHIMFGHQIFEISTKERNQFSLYFSEFVATFGLITTIRFVSHSHKNLTPFAVAAYIASAYWFTSSTSFANPAITIARTFTNTFAGINYSATIQFIIFQLIGTVLAEVFYRKTIGVAQCK